MTRGQYEFQILSIIIDQHLHLHIWCYLITDSNYKLLWVSLKNYYVIPQTQDIIKKIFFITQ